ERERRDQEHAARTARQLLVQQHDAGCDRNRIGGERRDSGRGDRVAVLERRLQLDGSQRVEDDERYDDEDPGSTEDDEPGRDVAAREEEAGGETEDGCVREARAGDTEN